jgi:molecular chaperone DnaK (HSP70)
MKGALFSIGIDLGTTNSALSFTRLDDEYAVSEVFSIPQWVSPTTVGNSSTLPSFLYLPSTAEAGHFGCDADAAPNWVVGKFSRAQAADLPGRVAHSAKSWLCHHAVDRSAPFLPWASDELSEEEKISPIRASALILGALRGAWNDAFAELGAQGRFDAQQITITVPASFDSAAQKLTLEAAELAGFSAGVQLIEEPQAAFYRWLERFPTRDELNKRLPELGQRDHYVLIVDVGGGTSDFSLFRLQLDESKTVPSIERVAVSDHILLGGDNVDLALAHMLAARMGDAELDADEKLSSKQWHYLVARCRDLKENALKVEGPDDEEFPVSIPGRGANLLAGTLSARLQRNELSALLLDGFFPSCPADQVPARSESALKEWGLPFASDSAVTHYLADFLQGQPQVDAVIFNGGALYPKPLRDRLVSVIGDWQSGKVPALLNNPEPDLAVARGAARYGWLTHRKEQRIEAGAARTLYLEVAGEKKGDPPSLLCILPRGTQPEETVSVERAGLKLRVNQPVRFRAFYSTKRNRDKPGAVLPMEQGKFHPLPALQTIARVSKIQANASGGQLPIRLATSLNALGLLQVSCVSALHGVDKEWPLEFNLRQGLSSAQGKTGGGFVREERAEAAESDSGTMPEGDAGVSEKEMRAATEVLRKVFSAKGKEGQRRKVSFAWLLKELQKALAGIPKHEWNWVLIRSLWPVLEECQDGRRNSADHEETWLSLAGYILRPGFGAELDELRMEELWQVRQSGLTFPGKRCRLQEYILWRRVSGGLSRERQEAVLQESMPVLHQQKNPPAELIRMAGALERVGQGLKRELIEMLLAKAVELSQRGEYADPYWVSLTLLLNRAPLYAGPESVVPSELVADAFAACEKLNWEKTAELQTLFLRAARIVDNPHLDLDPAVRKKIVSKLNKADVPPIRQIPLKEFVPIEKSDRISLFGESLPAGIVME